MTLRKPVHTIVLDAGPLLKNEPTVSTLISQSENLLTVPSVLDEIKDEHARSRIKTTLLPFLTIRSPSEYSLRFVTNFSKKTGDFAVLSRTDLLCLALTYELAFRQNSENQAASSRKGRNGSPPRKEHAASGDAPEAAHHSSTRGAQPAEDTGCSQEPNTVAPKAADHSSTIGAQPTGDTGCSQEPNTVAQKAADHSSTIGAQPTGDTGCTQEPNTVDPLEAAASDQGWLTRGTHEPTEADEAKAVSEGLGKFKFTDEDLQKDFTASSGPELPNVEQIMADSDSSDAEGWITLENVKKHQVKDTNGSTMPIPEDQQIQVALLSGDFAMQNVCLQIGLNLLSPSLQRIRNIRTYILRCHACFAKEKDMSKQFCSRCGKPTLTRVACSTNSKGEFKIHLKKNMQWNHRGDRFSIPKPVPGAANGKVGQGKGGGKGGWGQELILAEDQKEYLRATNGRSRKKETDLMDEDYLPSILTGDRGKAGGRPKIGAGRNVNSKKRI